MTDQLREDLARALADMVDHPGQLTEVREYDAARLLSQFQERAPIELGRVRSPTTTANRGGEAHLQPRLRRLYSVRASVPLAFTGVEAATPNGTPPSSGQRAG